jgi:hypothetical protein
VLITVAGNGAETGLVITEEIIEVFVLFKVDSLSLV